MSNPSTETIKAAKDIAWVIKSLWIAATALVLATVWIVALAQDVKTNTEKLNVAATEAQIISVAEALGRIETSLRNADTRQRAMKSQLDKVEADVNTLKENAE